MSGEADRLFAAFDDSPGRSPSPVGVDAIRIRPARLGDVEAVARLFAEREGGDVQAHAAAIRCALGSEAIGRSSLVLVAEVPCDDPVVGYGKVRLLDGDGGPDLGPAPKGWYLTGVVVAPIWRRRGIGARLTADRLRWISARSRFAYYVSNARNRVSIALHARFGFVEIDRGPVLAGCTFTGGEGVLFRVDLSRPGPTSPTE